MTKTDNHDAAERGAPGERPDRLGDRTPYQGECYCGLGPACHFWREFTPEERAMCTRDKRFTAEWFWRTGVLQ